MAAVKGRSGNIGRIGLDPQSPMMIFRGPFRAEKAEGKGRDGYFWTKDEMLNFMQDKVSSYTPMVWNRETKMYEIDFDSADLLGQ